MGSFKKLYKFFIHLIIILKGCYCLHPTDLFTHFDEENTTTLRNGDSSCELIKLEHPVHFYSEIYDHIYINTNGILTFQIEFAEYLNQPFPLEYPLIAPFYSNVDTSAENTTSTIIFFASKNSDKLFQASDLVRSSFSDASDFEADILYVATWDRVGYFDGKSDSLNTFQVAIASDNEETYVIFLYPQYALNWLQAEVGVLGLPDIRAQAGLISEDGRFYTLPGSGTDNVRFLAADSNIGRVGIWIYKVGPLDFNSNVVEPNLRGIKKEPTVANSCSSGGYQKCHLQAECIDKEGNFCCRCKEGYYGNGYQCLKDNIPLRISGSLSGTVNNLTIDDSMKLQAYVVTADGRSYTAINPINAELGHHLQLVLPLGSSIGWLFSKTFGNAKNGYQITGGHLQHSSTLIFPNSQDVLTVKQTFTGLNLWDQLAVKIEIDGSVPEIPVGTKLIVRDITEEFAYAANNIIQSHATIRAEVPADGSFIEYNLQQTIKFDQGCPFDNDTNLTQDEPVLQKISKINLDYHIPEQAIRIGMLNRIGVDPNANACTDGTATCGDNTICIPQDEDNYDCVCQNGYAPFQTDSGIENCVDIDECYGSNICDDKAHCQNIAGGYSCTCAEGYYGNGHECSKLADQEERRDQPIYRGVDKQESDPASSICDRCSSFAYCYNSACICHEGWTGDGFQCTPNCRSDEKWTNGQCVSTSSSSYTDEEINEVEAYCDDEGYCSCAEGYEYIILENVCRLNVYESESGGSSRQEDQEELISCNVDYRCHENATCEWSDLDYRHVCECIPGFEGNGLICVPVEATCTTQPGLCDVHASCVYSEVLGKSQCRCEPGYEGNGYRCQLAPECTAEKACGENAFCDKGVCLCLEGYERDISDFCVKAGTCGGTYCAENAICKWERSEKVTFCECIEGFIGDGVKSCKSIPPPCNIRNTCGLYASCLQNHRDPSRYECVCNPGFFGDGYVCIEEKNCRNTPSLCDPNAKCITTGSGLQCACNTGYLGNGTYCKEISQHETGFLLISQGVVVIRVPFDGKLGRPISVAQMAVGLDHDCAEGRIYWGDISAKKIMSAKYDGTDAKAFVTDDIVSPEGVAVDWISRNLYWTDSSKDTIEVASLDNAKLRAVLINKHLVNPRGIAVDPHKSKLYWSDWNRDAPKIESSNLDGTERETLVTKPQLILPNSLVVLRNSGELCYADAGTHKIECLDTYTRNLRQIATNLSYPFGLTSTEEHFYWTDWSTKQIESVDITGNRKQGLRTPVFGSHKMYGMTAITDQCPIFYSPCQIDNGGCPNDRICLVNKNAPSGKSCKCITTSTTCPINNEIHSE